DVFAVHRGNSPLKEIRGAVELFSGQHRKHFHAPTQRRGPTFPIEPKCDEGCLDLGISSTLCFQHRAPTLGDFSSLIAGGVFVLSACDISKKIDLSLPGARGSFRILYGLLAQLDKTLPRRLAEVLLAGAQSNSLHED